MIKRTLTLFLILFTSLLSGSFTLSKKNECDELVRKYYKNMSTRSVKESTELVNYLNFRVRSCARKLPIKPENISSSDVEYYVGSKQMRYLSKEISYFIDESNAFMVVPSRQTVYWIDSNLKRNADKRLNAFMAIQDTLLLMCNLKSCTTINDIPMDCDKEIVMVPNEKSKTRYSFNKATFLCNSKSEEVKQVKIDFEPGQELLWVEYTFLKTELDQKITGFDIPVKNIFIGNQSEKLIGKYSKFKLIDARNKKK